MEGILSRLQCVKVMSGHRTGEKQFPEKMVARISSMWVPSLCPVYLGTLEGLNDTMGVVYIFIFFTQIPGIAILVADGFYNYSDVIMGAMASQITGVSIVCLTDQRKHQTPRHWPLWRSPVYSPHNGPVTRKMFPLDHVIRFRKQCTHLKQCCHLM